MEDAEGHDGGVATRTLQLLTSNGERDTEMRSELKGKHVTRWPSGAVMDTGRCEASERFAQLLWRAATYTLRSRQQGVENRPRTQRATNGSLSFFPLRLDRGVRKSPSPIPSVCHVRKCQGNFQKAAAQWALACCTLHSSALARKRSECTQRTQLTHSWQACS